MSIDSTETPETQEKRKNVPAEKFVEAWQTASSLQEVAEKLGLSENYATTRAGKLREQKVNLKKFPRKTGGGGGGPDVAKLNALIAKLEEKKAEPEPAQA